MNVLACNAGAWLPFTDPNIDEVIWQRNEFKKSKGVMGIPRFLLLIIVDNSY